jgi:hypothetical protein
MVNRGFSRIYTDGEEDVEGDETTDDEGYIKSYRAIIQLFE